MKIDSVQKTVELTSRENAASTPVTVPATQQQGKLDGESRNTMDLNTAVEKSNEQIKKIGGILQFKLHEESERFYVQVFDASSQKVIKTLPAEDFLDVVGKIHEAVGLLIDEKK